MYINGKLYISNRSVVSLIYLQISIKSQSKSQENFFVEIDKLILKYVWKFKWLRIQETIFKKKNKDLLEDLLQCHNN